MRLKNIKAVGKNMDAQDDNSSCNGNFCNFVLSEIIGMNEEIIKIKNKIIELARNDSTVLIEGETGTGKELVARAIHNCSPRSDKPLVIVNCGTIPEHLMDSYLFGHIKGAYTDAKDDRAGKFACAECGTIFIDEIGNISPEVRAKLLRVLEYKTYEPLGSDREKKADVRIITATNKNLETLVNQGAFTLDLYHRINVIKITLPPLRERKDDIRLLVNHFIAFYNKQFNKNITATSNEVGYILLNYHYPGNVRELKGIIEHAFNSCKSEIIECQDLPDVLKPEPENLTPYRGASLEDYDAWVIENTLKKNKGNKIKTAEELRIDRTTLARKMKNYGITLLFYLIDSGMLE